MTSSFSKVDQGILPPWDKWTETAPYPMPGRDTVSSFIGAARENLRPSEEKYFYL
jgi:hypothetical protein